MNDIAELRLRYMGAVECYRLLEETGASQAALNQQQAHCRALRGLLNANCADSEHYDPFADNVVHAPV